MPATLLTRQEWEAHPASRKPGASYQGYTQWVTRKRGERAAARRARSLDPLAPTPAAELERSVRQSVSARVDPLIREILRETDKSAGAIEGLTEQYAERLGAFQGATKGVYDRAKGEAAGVSDALRAALSGSGAEAGKGLRETLAAAGAPERLVDEVAGGTETFGRGAANAGLAQDAAGLGALISRAAGAEEYAGLLPGFARSEGLQAIGNLRGERQRQVGEIRAKVPALVAELLESAQNRELQKGIAREGLRQDQAEFGQRQAEAAAAAADRSAQAGERIRQAGERIKLTGSNQSFNQAVAAANLKLRQDEYALAIKREERLAKPAGKGGFSGAQRKDFGEIAFDTAGDDFDAGTEPVETLRDLMAAGVPFSIAVRAIQRFAKKEKANDKWRATLGWTKRK